MHAFERLTENVYRLCIPFENLYTTVYLILAGEEAILLDSATTREDMEQYLFPALEAFPQRITWLVASHPHGDHAGGLPTLVERFPEAKVATLGTDLPSAHPDWNWAPIQDGSLLCGCVRVLHLPGHTMDALGLLDTRTHTLLSCDCLQQYGVGRYGTSLATVSGYLHSLETLAKLDIRLLAAAHDYVPLGYRAEGAEQVKAYLAQCAECIAHYRRIRDAHPDLDPKQLARQFREENPQLPPVAFYTFESL